MITKRIHSQDAYYKLSSKKSGETSINITYDILGLIAPNLTKGSESKITFTIYREDYLKALGAIVNISPLYTSSSTSSTEVKSDPSVFLKDFQAICVFFGSNDKNTYTVNINYRVDGRIYLNSLEDSVSKFNLRRFLVEEKSILEFENANNEITIRLKTELDSFKVCNTVKTELVREKLAATFLKTAMKKTLSLDNNFASLLTHKKWKVTKDKNNLVIDEFWFGRDKNQPPTRKSDIYPDVSWSYYGVDYELNVEITPDKMEKFFFPVYNDAYKKQLYMEKDLNGDYVLYQISSQRQVNSLNIFPRQQIFYGAPGTGKSFKIKECTQGDDTVIRTTFHPDSDYSTFVGCYKPTMEEEEVRVVPVVVTSGISLDQNKGTYNEKRITYKFVQQAFTKAYIQAWKKRCDTSLGAIIATVIPPAGKAATPYNTTSKIGAYEDFDYTSDKATLTNSEKDALLEVDKFDFPFDGIKNFGELHDKIKVVVTDKPTPEQNERYPKEITLTAEQIRFFYSRYLERETSHDPDMDLIPFFLRAAALKLGIEIKQLENYEGDDVTIPINNNLIPELLGLYDPQIKTVFLFKDNIGDDKNLLCAVYTHEMFHAYYDNSNNSGNKYIPEIEEPIVECNTLCFLELFNNGMLKDYLVHVTDKRFSPIINYYGFGAHLYENRSLNWMKLYQNAYNHIDDSSSIVNKYKKKFSPIYPFGNEEETRDLLYIILKGIKATASSGFSKADQFLIIEEINRGNCAQIFGDLFQLLDRGDDGYSEYPIEADDDLRKELEREFKTLNWDSVKCEIDSIFKENYPHGITDKIKSGKLLVLPKNLYIWATMNTSDQSLFPIDSAFKRRWEWKYIPISYKNKDWVIEIGDKTYMWVDFQREINNRIYSIDNSEDKQLGDFFVDANRTGNVMSADTLLNKILFYIWNDVCKDDPDQIFRWIDYKDKKEKSIRFSDFFTDDKDQKLQGLMSFLGIKTKGEAAEEEEEETPIISTGAEESETDVVTEKGEGE